jgi:hypothetical protein
MTADVRRSPRRGTTSACALKAYAPEAGTRDRCMHSGDASFARSFDTCTLILTMHRRRKPRWWGVRVGITVGKTHACGRNLHWGFRERTAHGSPRVTASAREMAWHVRKGRRSRPPSLRGSRELGFGCPHVEIALQKLAGDVWSQIRSANALQKGRSGSSERGPSSERKSAGGTAGGPVERKIRRESDSPLRRERTGRRLRVARDRHPAAHPSPKAVCGSRDRGCNDHRILRRVPIDGRHSGSSRGVGLHGAASTVVSAASTPSDPYQTDQKKDVRPGCSPREGGRGVRVNRSLRQECQRLDRISAVGRKRPRS